MSQQTELQGFLSIKIPPKMRGFLPWKVWRRQWISIRCLPAGGIDLMVGRNSQNALHISPSDIVVRTRSRSHLYAFGVFPRGAATANFCLAGVSETDSQKWMTTIRKLLRPPLLPVEESEFFVSVVDNTFTRSSGFPGLYGILRITNAGITIVDPFTSKIKACWLWRQLSHLYIASTLRPEDTGRICTIITSKEFPSGVGQIRLFCLEAMNLIQELTRGKSNSFVKFHTAKRSIPYRHFTFSHEIRGGMEGNSAPCSWLQMSRRRSSLSETVKCNRRLSKSEGNLLSLLDQFDNSSECSDSGFIHDFYNSVFSACFSDNEEKSSTDGSDGSPVARKVTPGRNLPVADVIITSDSNVYESSHVYQKVGSEAEDEVEAAPHTVQMRKSSPRRQSGVSIASGVYEEIDELSIFTSSLTTVEENSSDPPPPLPPRRDSFYKSLKRNIYENVSLLPLPSFSSKFISKSAGNTPLSSPPSLSRTPSSAEFIAGSWQKEEESHYLPMNPCSKYLGIQPKNDSFSKDANEEIYVVMSNFKKDQT